MNYYVYILINIEKKPFFTYVGYTSNLKKRLFFHNTSKGAKFTRGRLWKLIYKKNYITKQEALKNEYRLKKNKKERAKIKMKYLVKNNLV
jgi:putative endonuclease